MCACVFFFLGGVWVGDVISNKQAKKEFLVRIMRNVT